MADKAFPPLTLPADGILLRPLTEADVPDITAAGADELIQRWLPLPNPYTEQDARWFCQEFAPAQLESGRGLVLGIELEGREGRLGGVIDLKRTDWPARTTEIGYWTSPWARRQGVMRRAVSALSRWVLDDRGFARIEIRDATGNVASQGVAIAAGFMKEGILRNAGFVHDGRVDLIVYSLIDSDLEPTHLPRREGATSLHEAMTRQQRPR